TKVLATKDGRVWVGSSAGMSVLEGGRMRPVWQSERDADPHTRYVTSMTAWKQDTIALGTLGGLVLYNTRDGGFRRLFDTGGLPITITRLHVDTRGRLWLGTWSHGCIVMDSCGRICESLKPERPSAGKTVNIVTGFAETGSKGATRLWVGTENGIYEVADGKVTTTIPMASGEVVTSLTADNDQYVWAGGNTIYRFFAGRSDFGVFASPITGFVTGIQPVKFNHQPAIAFLTWYVPGGLTVTNPEGTRILYKRTCTDKSDAANVAGLATDSLGRIWLSTLGGMEILDGHFQPLRHGDSCFKGPDRLVTERTDGVLIHHDTAWIAYYRRGLSLYDMHFHLLHTFAKDDGSGLVDDLVNRIFADHEGRVWLGGDNRLYGYDAAAERFRAYNGNPDGSPFHVSDIAQLPGGDLVLATTTGLFRFNPSTGACSRVRSPLLRDNVVEAAAVDAGGDIWFINRENLIYYQVRTGHFTLFGSEDGMDIRDNLNFLRSPDGEHFYLNGNNHTFTFNRSSRRSSVSPMPLYFHSIQVNDSALPRSAALSTLQLDHAHNRITLEFGAINYIKPEQTLYGYMLTGVDNKWVYSNRNYASYANLSPGSYVFKLRAQNYAGIWSDAISLPVTILPPYWATWWFRALSMVLIGAVVFFSVRYVAQRNLRERILRLQQEQAVEKERNRIARDMHDDLGSGLTKIAILSEVTKAQLAAPGAAVTNLDVISNTSRELVDNLQDIVWVLNPRNDSLSSLLMYIKDYAAGFFEPAGIVCSVDCDQVEGNIPLSEEKRRNIFLSVKESCNNVLKYAGCTEVSIRVRIGPASVVIEITDNGAGFDPGQVGQFSNGLRNMRNRMEQIGSRFRVISAVGEGTKVRMEVMI
ncbi:MAG TPA: triple tyrosine motif-containing protein, partial [Puia sp.]|nr:triple tyrosine motif-containing protein [Puia sp.]